MPQCSATCKDGGACHHKAKSGLTTCAKHSSQGQVKTIYVILCGFRMTDGNKCKCPRAKGMNRCKRHHNVEVKRARKEVMDRLWEDILGFLWEPRGRPQDLMNYVNARLDEVVATPQERADMLGHALDERDFYYTIHPPWGPGPGVARTELEALSRDTQNVHTPAVNQQTADGITALLETPVAVGQDTLAELEEVWGTRSPIARKSVLKDMSRWYATQSCRSMGDHLYQRLLDGLWTRIKLSKHKEDLVQRLWEECVESLKMCCEGHISRLCNVLVGYDDSFKAPISAGEMLQHRIAAIAAEDISIPHKVVKAWEVMEELSIPRDQRMEWIEAL